MKAGDGCAQLRRPSACLLFNLLQFDLRGSQQLLCGVELIRLLVKDAPDTGVHQHFETMDTRSVGHIDIRPTDIDAILCRLSNGIDFRVDGPVAVLLGLPGRGLRFVNQAANLGAMGHAGRRTVVACCQNVPLANDDGPNLGTLAGRTLGHLARNSHEVLIPGKTISHGRYTKVQVDDGDETGGCPLEYAAG